MTFREFRYSFFFYILQKSNVIMMTVGRKKHTPLRNL